MLPEETGASEGATSLCACSHRTATALATTHHQGEKPTEGKGAAKARERVRLAPDTANHFFASAEAESGNKQPFSRWWEDDTKRQS